MPFQDAKQDAPNVGKIGRIVNFEAGAHEIGDGLTAAQTNIGIIVSRNATGQIVAGVPATGAKFVGISADQSYIVDAGYAADTGKAQVKAGGRIPFVRKGTITVKSPGDVNPTSDVRYVIATGEITNAAAGSTNAVLAGATYEDVGVANGLVSIRLNS